MKAERMKKTQKDNNFPFFFFPQIPFTFSTEINSAMHQMSLTAKHVSQEGSKGEK